MNAAALADAVLLLHVLIIAFIVFGLPLTWIGAWRGWAFVRGAWFRLSHLGLIAFVVLQTWLDQLCPLTVWEHQLRTAAGQGGYQRSFIEHWLHDLIFVDLSLATLALIYTAFGLLVALTFWWVPLRDDRGSKAKARMTPGA